MSRYQDVILRKNSIFFNNKLKIKFKNTSIELTINMFYPHTSHIMILISGLKYAVHLYIYYDKCFI